MSVLPNMRRFFSSLPTRAPQAQFSDGSGLTEQDFLVSIAHLPSAEQQRKLWYWRLAQRQGIMEVEERRYY